jgi:hypothetical protein
MSFGRRKVLGTSLLGTLVQGMPRRIGHRHRHVQPLRVRMPGIAEHGLARADFDDLAEIDHGHPVRDRPLLHPDGDPNSFGVMSCRRVFPFLAQPNRVATSSEVY